MLKRNSFPHLKYHEDFSSTIDPILIKLTLVDYDWMTYTIEINMKTKDYGVITLECSYSGVGVSDLTITQINEKNFDTFVFSTQIDSKIFTEFLKEYTTLHSKQWESKDAFNGDQLAVDFYNKMVDIVNKQIS